MKAFLYGKVKYMAQLAAVGGILIGVLREENRTVLTKAINVCLECIGIG